MAQLTDIWELPLPGDAFCSCVVRLTGAYQRPSAYECWYMTFFPYFSTGTRRICAVRNIWPSVNAIFLTNWGQHITESVGVLHYREVHSPSVGLYKLLLLLFALTVVYYQLRKNVQHQISSLDSPRDVSPLKARMFWTYTNKCWHAAQTLTKVFWTLNSHLQMYVKLAF